jgi:hypothetical protein
MPDREGMSDEEYQELMDEAATAQGIEPRHQRVWGSEHEQHVPPEEMEILPGESRKPRPELTVGMARRTSPEGQMPEGFEAREIQGTMRRRVIAAEGPLHEAFFTMRPLYTDEYVQLLGAARDARDWAKGEGRCETCEQQWRYSIEAIQKYRDKRRWNTYDFAYVAQPFFFLHYRPMMMHGEREHLTLGGRAAPTTSPREHRAAMIKAGYTKDPWSLKSPEHGTPPYDLDRYPLGHITMVQPAVPHVMDARAREHRKRAKELRKQREQIRAEEPFRPWHIDPGPHHGYYVTPEPDYDGDET